MPKKVPLISIGVQRDGKTMNPEIGKPFDFTDEELTDIAKMEAVAGVDYVRDPVNEEADVPAKKSGKADKKASSDNL